MSQISEKFNFRLLTFISLAFMLVIMLWVSKDYGITGDEVTQNTYGETVYKYFASGGKDKSALTYRNVYFYGGFYDLICVTVNKMLGTSDANVYNVRHFINAIFGFLAIVVTGLLARYYKGWGAALLTVWFLFLSPRFFGESMNNPKDIPFALGMMMGIYCTCRFLDSFPKLSWKRALWLAMAIGFTIGIRVGGLLLIPFVFVGVAIEYWFVWRKNYSLSSLEIRKLVVYLACIAFGGYLLGLVAWPYAIEKPFTNPFKALSEMSQFSIGIRMLFEDKQFFSHLVPPYYTAKWIFISSPIIILLGLVLSPVLFTQKESKKEKLLFLFFVLLFPPLYVIYKQSPLYDGWRHSLFLWPLICVISALSFIALMGFLKGQGAKYGVIGVIMLGLLLPARWSVANHPNQIVYFNELVGGIDGAFGYYETDYYMNSVKQATYKLAQEKDLYNTKDTIVIATNCIDPVSCYAIAISPKIKAVYVRYHQRYDTDYDYGIFVSRFIDRHLLQNGYFPPANTILEIKADNTPLSIVVTHDKDKNALKGFNAIQQRDFEQSIAYYEKALAADPDNETAYMYYGAALASVGQMSAAAAVLNKGLELAPENLQMYDVLIKVYKAQGNTQAAQDAFNRAQAIKIEQVGEEEAGGR
jgi:hypothetical protein